MRVTEKMNQAQVLNNIQKSRSELLSLQNQAATGKKITQPSDDPAGAAKILTTRTEGKILEQYDRGITNAKTFLESTESTLNQLGESLVRAKELSIQGASDSNGGTSREMIAVEIGQIYNSIIEMANRRVGERFMFGGHQTLAQPFDHDGKYAGDDGEIKIAANKGNFIALNLTGDRVFMGHGIGSGGLLKSNPETPQSLSELQQYKLSEFNREQKNASNEEDRLKKREPANTGRIQRVGENSSIVGSQGVNIFDLVRSLEIALKTNDKQGIQQALEPLDQALNQVSLARAEIGGRVNQLNATSEGIQKTLVENKIANSQIEDADLFQVMTDLNKADTSLKGSLETSHKLLSTSLLDFLK